MEQDFDVNKIEYKNIKLWPIIRAYFYGKHVFGNKKDPVPKKTYNSWFKLKIDIFQHSRAVKTLLRETNLPQNIDYLFVGRAVDHTDKIHGKPYSRHTDPYYDVFADGFNCAKIEIGETLPRFISTIFLPYWIAQFETPKIQLRNSYIQTLSDIYNYSFEDDELNIFLNYLSYRISRVCYLS